MLWLDLRSARDATLVLLPVLIGLSTLLLWALALGHSLTFLSLFVVVMLVGIGVAYGLHKVHAGRRREGDAGSRTARGVLLAAATTAIGFGALLASSFPGLAAVGELAVVGAVRARSPRCSWCRRCSAAGRCDRASWECLVAMAERAAGRGLIPVLP